MLEKEKNWWKNSAVYQVYPKSFYDSDNDGFGDLEGIRQKLSYIKALGTDVLWVCPFFTSPQADNGYDIADYLNVDRRFGTMNDLRRLIDDCHALDIKFVLDLVANHTSDEHPWFKKALAGDEKYQNYYYFKDPVNGKAPSNWASVFGAGAWEYVPSLNKYYLHLFHKKQPDLNWENKQVVDEIIKIMQFWAQYGVDGFRLDAINYLYKDPDFPNVEPKPGSEFGFANIHYANKPKVNEHFARLNREVFTPYNMMTVAEVAYIDPEIAHQYCGKYTPEVDMLYIFDLLNFDQNGFDKFAPLPFDVKAFKQAIFTWQKEMDSHGHLALFFSNHDQARSVSRFGDDSDEYRDLCAKMQGNAMYMLKGTPYIYQGEELGMTNLSYDDINDFRDVEVFATYKEKVIDGGESLEKWMKLYNSRSRDNGRSPMQWNTSENGGFSKAQPWQKVNSNYPKINVSLQEADPNSTLNFYRKLLKTRKQLISITRGDVQPIDADSQNTFCYSRNTENQRVISLNNFSKDNSIVILDEKPYSVLLSNYGDVKMVKGKVVLRAYECITAIFEK